MPRPETAAPVPPEIKEEKIRTCETRRWRCHEHAKSKFSYLDRGATLLPSIGVEKGGLAHVNRASDPTATFVLYVHDCLCMPMCILTSCVVCCMVYRCVLSQSPQAY